MLTENMKAVYGRLLVLGVLCACLAVFSSSALTERVFAAAHCQQDCAPEQDMCNDNCAFECGTDDPNCNGCITTCQSDYQSCLGYSIYCSGGATYQYTPNCQVQWTYHCAIVNNQCDPNNTNNHWGYAQICNYAPGGNQCVYCPGLEYCTGSNGLPPCP